MAEHLIAKNGEGVLGFITNNGYLDNPTFRGMRWHLLNSFDKVYVLDLHGSSKKREKTPDGSKDANVFDIMQGVSIIIAIKNKPNDEQLAELMHGDLWGGRAEKYKILNELRLVDGLFKKLDVMPPQYPFVQRNWSDVADYLAGFSVNEFMPLNGNGIVTKRDKLNVHHSPSGVKQVVDDFVNLDEELVREKYNLPEDVRDWRYSWAKQDIEKEAPNVPVQAIGYRLFDRRYIFYSGRARGLVGWPVAQVMCHYTRGKNIGLLTTKAHRDSEFAHVFITDQPTEAIHFSATTGSNAMNFPLYLYPEGDLHDSGRQINFAPKLYAKIQKLAEHPIHGVPDEVAVFDYIYGSLHCPAYRNAYSEYLRIDFPRIPWPASPKEFWDVSSKGNSLRKLHLMDAAAVGVTPFPFLGEGNNVVTTLRFEEQKVWINASQYFDNAPLASWNFYIGGYQPAQKWLKDRKGCALSFEDVKHYQRILKILSETDRIMRAITMTLDTGE